MNRGDALPVYLDIMVSIDGGEPIPLIEAGMDEIEVRFGFNRYLLSEGTIIADSEEGMYYFFLTQEQSFNLNRMYSDWQIRVRKGNEVGSTPTTKQHVGRTISRDII